MPVPVKRSELAKLLGQMPAGQKPFVPDYAIPYWAASIEAREAARTGTAPQPPDFLLDAMTARLPEQLRVRLQPALTAEIVRRWMQWTPEQEYWPPFGTVPLPIGRGGEYKDVTVPMPKSFTEAAQRETAYSNYPGSRPSQPAEAIGTEALRQGISAEALKQALQAMTQQRPQPAARQQQKPQGLLQHLIRIIRGVL